MKASKGEDIQPSQIKRIYAKAPPPGWPPFSPGRFNRRRSQLDCRPLICHDEIFTFWLA